MARHFHRIHVLNLQTLRDFGFWTPSNFETTLKLFPIPSRQGKIAGGRCDPNIGGFAEAQHVEHWSLGLIAYKMDLQKSDSLTLVIERWMNRFALTRVD